MESVVATVIYHDDGIDDESFVYPYDPPEGKPRASGLGDPREVTVYNGWRHADNLSLDTEGLAIAKVPTSFENWFDREAVVRDYYPEVIAAACRITGAAHGVIFDHNVRSGSKSKDGFWSKTIAQPSRGAHNDYTDLSGPQRAAELLGQTPTTRYAFVNLWRPIQEPLRSSPLAMIDGRTITAEDRSHTELRYPDRSGWIHRIRYNPDHRWLFFPEMLKDEALFLKCWDSALDGRTRSSAHAAIDDPTVPADAPPRESIEARALLVWD